MQNLVIDQPYRFVPPYRATFWAGTFEFWLPYHLRRSYGIESVEFRGVERLRDSLEYRDGIALTLNHCPRKVRFKIDFLGLLFMLWRVVEDRFTARGLLKIPGQNFL